MRHPKLADVDRSLLTRIGDRAIDALDRYGWLERRPPTKARTMPEPDPQPEPPAKRKHAKNPDAPPPSFHSQYKGVSVNRGKFVGRWGKSVGQLRERTAQGERDAAQDRARALGLDYLEMRDGTREPWAPMIGIPLP